MWELTGVVASVAATIAGAVISFLVRRVPFQRYLVAAANVRNLRQDNETECRLTEAKHLLNRQEVVAVWNRRANGFLTFAQYEGKVGGKSRDTSHNKNDLAI